MKYAILADIHANLEAFEAVIEKARELDVDKFVCLGDVVGYNANPSECIELLKSLDPEVVVKGNHDEQASVDSDLVGFNPQAAMAIDWTRKNLTTEQRQWLADLPYRQTIGTKVTFVHATLDMPHMWGYIFDKFSATACLSYQFTQVCFFGHTHVPMGFEKYNAVIGNKYSEINFQAGHKYLINTGSVGQPRDGDPRSSFVVYSPDERKATIHRVEYDIEKCQEKIRKAHLPERLAQRLEFGR